MGAWIETPKVLRYVSIKVSHPIWVRGLKRRNAVGLKNLN